MAFVGDNVVSVSWTDHLSFGEGEGRLDDPDKVRRRLRAWRDELGAGAIHWRMARSRIPGRFFAGRGYRHPSQAAARRQAWDDLDVVPGLVHQAGLGAWLYVSLFDEGWPLLPPRTRAVSYHNAMHGQHVSWQSDLTRLHPEWLVVDRTGRRRQWGVVSLAYPQARRAFIDRWKRVIERTRFDGLFVCLRSQSKPARRGDEFGFNEPARAEYERRYSSGRTDDAGALANWRNLLGEYLTTLLMELRESLSTMGRKLAVGVARGDVLGPPLGNATLHWRDWLRRGLIDELVVNQNSSQCPSMWHQLWPMHRGVGYVQNYLDGAGLPPLLEHLGAVYGPEVQRTPARLLVACQWSERSEKREAELRSIRGVSGLVFSSFRHDNPEAVGRGDWRAGRIDDSAIHEPE
jgi:hypothetical protein